MDAYTCQAELSNMASALQSVDCREQLVSIRQLALEDINEAYGSATSPDGQAWPPAGNTSRDRGSNRNLRRIKPLLVDTGAMIGASIGRNAGTASMQEFNSIAVGVLDGVIPYAKYHQTGTKTLPARPFIGMREDSIDQGAELLAERILKKVFG